MDDIRFHQASVLEAALDLIEDGEGGTLTVQWQPRIADYERSDPQGVLRCVVRARSGAASQVVSSDLWAAGRRWAGLEAPLAAFVYHAEAPLYPTAVTVVAERLDRFAAGVPTEDDRKVVRVIGLSPDSRCLRHVHLRTRSGPLDQMVAGIRWRVRRLIELRPTPGRAAGAGPLGLVGRDGIARRVSRGEAAVDAVSAAIERLLSCCGAERGKTRTVTAALASEALGVCPGRLLDGPAWDPGEIGAYVEATLRAGASALRGLGDRPAPQVLPAGGQVLPAAAQPIGRVLDLPTGAAMLGPASPRMEAAIRVLAWEAAGAGAVPFVMDVRGYRFRSLMDSVRGRLELVAGMRIGAASARRFLSRPGLVLLLDATLACVDAEAALVRDLEPVRQRNPALRVLAFGMASGQARMLGLPLFRLQAAGGGRAPEGTRHVG